MQHQSSLATKQRQAQNAPPSINENSESEHIDDERGGKKVTEWTVKWLQQAHEGPNTSTTDQKNNKDNMASASCPSTAPSATYDNMDDLVTTTTHPGVASNVSSHMVSMATVPDDLDKDNSAVNGHTSCTTMETRSINDMDSSGNEDEKTDKRQEPINAEGFLIDMQVQAIDDVT
ncbi:hypothetical protein PAXRUDRAFT_13590 [Paxillus rubicundulus Ve08.2h10]|uniref:Uncharacterized protein n=1 Tax=Paxillus rubicundulus Ve08.2h10 TaxID=930991 RepID=A0A0D0D5A7_9AGAM|nr:hypothetical protein PAXRUDRAFT_13590 [Paxillus rubicundulus Ve08.2h10]